MSLTGEWAGYYLDPRAEGEFSLVAVFEEPEGRLFGTMTDERTTWSQTLQEVIRGIPANSPHVRAWSEFAAEYPEAVYRTTLPAESSLSGIVRGMTVIFTKQYTGEQEDTWSAPNLDPATETSPCAPVEYRGILNAEGTEIWGEWRIAGPPLFGFIKRDLATGAFRLKRRLPAEAS